MRHISPHSRPDGGAGRVAAVMFPTTVAERAALAAALGDGWAISDARQAERPAAVLVRPCSDQTMTAVRQRFPGARIIVLDSPLAAAGGRRGPIQRALDAGADLYLSEATAA